MIICHKLDKHEWDQLVSVYTRTEDTGIEYSVRPQKGGYLAWVSYWGRVVADEGFQEKDYDSDTEAYAAVLLWFKIIKATAKRNSHAM